MLFTAWLRIFIWLVWKEIKIKIHRHLSNLWFANDIVFFSSDSNKLKKMIGCLNPRECFMQKVYCQDCQPSLLSTFSDTRVRQYLCWRMWATPGVTSLFPSYCWARMSKQQSLSAPDRTRWSSHELYSHIFTTNAREVMSCWVLVKKATALINMSLSSVKSARLHHSVVQILKRIWINVETASIKLKPLPILS